MSESTMAGGRAATGLPRIFAGLQVQALSTRAALVLLVGVSFVVRFAAAFFRSTPRFFPDEYIYTALGRSLARGHLEIRGGPAHFPALLEPLLTAPIWLLGDVELSYRVLQGVHAAAMSLAAVPAFALARHLGIGPRRALLVATASVSVPALVYSSYATADAIAYPLVVWAALLAVRAIERPSLGRQAAFLGVAGAASFARLQYVVLVAAFLGAAVLVAGARPREVVRGAGLVLAAVLLALLAAAATGGAALLGVYGGLFSSRIEPVALAHWMALDSMFLVYASGAVLVPTAVVGLVYGLRRSSPRAERAFAAFTAVLLTSALFESALIVTNESGRFYERYLIGLFPLLPIAFCIGFRLLPAGRVVAGGVAVALLIAAMLVPLAEYTVAFGAQDSPFLQAVSALEQHLGYADGSLAVAAAVSAAALAAVIATWRQRGADVLLASAVIVTAVASVGTVGWDRDRSHYVRSELMAPDARWIDHAHAGPAALLVLPGDPSTPMFDLFWNPSLDRVILLPGAAPIDSFASTRMTIDSHGTMLVQGRPLRTSFAIRGAWGAALLSGARRVASGGSATLWAPQGRPALRLLTLGRYEDGWLASTASIWAYPPPLRAGALVRIPVSLPRGFPRTTLDVTVQGSPAHPIAVEAGRTRILTVPVGSSKGRVVIELHARHTNVADGRIVSVRAGLPQLVVDSPVRATQG